MSNRVKVLIVDDDSDIIKAAKRVLETQGYRVIVALDGEECLEKIREEEPDLIILDLLMPKLDGFGVYRELNENVEYARYSDIPILIATAVREDASRRRYELETGIDLDVDDYVEKPIRPLDLLHRVEKLLLKAENSNLKAESSNLKAESSNLKAKS